MQVTCSVSKNTYNKGTYHILKGALSLLQVSDNWATMWSANRVYTCWGLCVCCGGRRVSWQRPHVQRPELRSLFKDLRGGQCEECGVRGDWNVEEVSNQAGLIHSFSYTYTPHTIFFHTLSPSQVFLLWTAFTISPLVGVTEWPP